MSTSLIDEGVCDVMRIRLFVDDAQEVAIPEQGFAEDVMKVAVPGDEPMRLRLCWPPVRVETVTVNGEVVTVDGDPVYVLIDDA